MLAAVMLAGILPAATSATTGTTMASSILTWVNRDRAARGLRPLRLDGRLASVAVQRATTMARANVLSHTIAGDLSSEIRSNAIQYYSLGEDIAWTTYPWGSSAAASLYSLWKGSPAHWALLMSSTFNYVGVGVALTSSGRTYGSVVFTEAVDHTRPIARMTGASRYGTTVTWYWSGRDPLLQTHTAGVRNFDVEYRVGLGAWRLIRTGTTGHSLRLTGRSHGHSYTVRVRAKDWSGNHSVWSSTLRVYVP